MIILKKITTLVILLVIMTCALIGNMSTSSALTMRRQIKVGVLLSNVDNPYLSSVQKTLEDIQRENIDKVQFTFYDAKNNRAIQETTINNLVQGRKVDILFANLVDKGSDSVRNLIDKARQNEIPVIFFSFAEPDTIDIIKDYKKAFVVSYDEKQTGILEGKFIVDAWNTDKSSIDKNKDGILQYIMLQASNNNVVAVERTKNAISSINNAGIRTQELALVNAYFDKELAKEAIESLFIKYGNKIEAIISNNDAMAIGAIEALQKYGYNKDDKSKNIVVVGVDGVQEAKDLIDKGIMTGTIIHDPRLLAEALYTIGMNLVSNINPLEGTNYKFEDNGVEVHIPTEVYGKSVSS
ncbi:methyl-galactoside transport system substrate-binding protein [Clostridium beijerinckii]|uniref:galactose ABC transporter substrate-binding protein n=1 Tax=Clostridium beijerinckii TaxID=1520 RepID=UPI0014943BF2|nr:galactose ABC transporter substrate-binding protein [Clostridium beijerinckii]NOW86779.1 methyl-galactoside transport system substrate-binding protein [Clostridium beijerinckii]